MAGQQSIEAQRSESVENMVIICVAFLAFVVFCYFYYEHPWYYVSLGFYGALSYVPEIVLKVCFFWQWSNVEMIPLMYDDLTFHASDYSKYYLSEDVGIRKKRSMDNLAMLMMLPFVAILFFRTLYKELKKKKSIIKKPSERNKSSALYRYVKSQSEIWVYIKPIVNIMEDMLEKNSSLDNEWYASAELPLAWMKRKGLFKMVKNESRRNLLTVRQKTEFSLDRKKAYNELRTNLGPLWRGLEELSFEEKCILAVIVPHAFGRIAMSRLMNRKLSRYHEQKKSKEAEAEAPRLLKEIEEEVEKILELHKDAFETPYFEEASFEDPFDPILSSFEDISSEEDMFKKGEQSIQNTLLTHCYVKTVFFSIVEKSWVYGVLASAEMLWIKTVDRDLWYVVSQQGRVSSFVEVCGAWSHYLAEDAYGFKSIMPQVEEGLRGLDFELFKTHDNVIPHEQWEDQSKWDRLVPDGIGKGSSIASTPGGKNASREV